MSTSVFVMIECDAPRPERTGDLPGTTIPAGTCNEWWQYERTGTSRREARRAAAREGWAYVPAKATKAMDLCPACARRLGERPGRTS